MTVLGRRIEALDAKVKNSSADPVIPTVMSSVTSYVRGTAEHF